MENNLIIKLMKNSLMISLSKKKALLSIIGALIFVVIGFFGAIRPEDFVSPIMRNAEVIRISGIVSIIFFGLCFIFIARKLFDRNPGLIVDQFGITDNTNASSVGLIEWNDITGIEIKQVMSSKFLIVYTNDPEKYIRNAKNIISKQLLKMNHKTYGSPLTISFSSIKTDIDELEQLIRFELERRSSK